jgi:hypothetical protein
MVIASLQAPAVPHRVAAVLRRASRRLARLSRWPSARGRRAAAGFDLHAEAGAPEGALHVDGVPVGSAASRRRL